ncbi:2TM domain-containing protein [Thalassobellus sediminis]|uniref:2TM domain-containing protein n=1 Tax=Thalassobellus sediminis TaxID=3367753 RepID=UPI00378F428F
MKTLNEKNESYIKAKEKVKSIQIFYIHLVGYIIVVLLLSYNIYIAAGEYRNFFVWLDIFFLVAWTIFIVLHGRNVFKGKRIFNKSWEERKIKEHIEKQQRKNK